ncbi:hypothetical protein [Sciscionella marina]|uniref:hypothetical protein n=1 Tax=Sciscionella marina TaxID=508770 RepID=UPI00038208AA|nr:hypothetical protein [Sciscionella marina]
MEPDTALSPDGFAAEFLRRAASPDRIAAIVRDLVGDHIEFGPVPVGPGGIATAKATGKVRFVHGEPRGGDGTRVDVHTEVDVHISVRVAGRTVRFEALMLNTNRITLRLVAPLLIVIDIADMAEEDISLQLALPGMVARTLQRVGNVDAEVREHTKGYIDRLVRSERAAALMRIDVGRLIDQAWSSGLVLDGLHKD